MYEIVLKTGKEKQLLKHHPWVFSGAIDSVSPIFKDGDLARVTASDGRFVAYGWYDEKKQSYREVFLDVNKLFETVYKCMLTDIYDEGCVSFGSDVKKYLNHIKFCGKKFLESVTFYYVVKLLEEALPEIEATQEEKGSVLQQLKELKTKVYDVHNNEGRA